MSGEKVKKSVPFIRPCSYTYCTASLYQALSGTSEKGWAPLTASVGMGNIPTTKHSASKRLKNEFGLRMMISPF